MAGELPTQDQRWLDASSSRLLTEQRVALVQVFGQAVGFARSRGAPRADTAIVLLNIAAELALAEGVNAATFEDSAKRMWALARAHGGPLRAIGANP